MQAVFNEIIRLGDILDENGIDFVRKKAATDEENIKNIENQLCITLPEDYKKFLLYANGLSYGSSEVHPVEEVCKYEFDNKYYIIGAFIGDGSLVVSDNEGNVYYYDHEFGVEETTFTDFLDKWIIRLQKDDLKDNGVEA